MVSPRDTQELVERVREGILGAPLGQRRVPLAALTELAERLEAAERKLAQGWDEVVAKDKTRAIQAEIRAEAAERDLASSQEHLEAAERKRDEYRNARRMMAADREALERDLSASQDAALLLHKRVEELEDTLKQTEQACDNGWGTAGRNLIRAEAAEAQLAERDKRIQEAQVLLMEGAELVLARDKRIEGLREASGLIVECEDALTEDGYAYLVDAARAALTDPVVVPGWEWDFKQEC